MRSTTTVQLTALDGSLYTGKALITDKALQDYFTDDPILMVQYPAGDCDTINWPKYNAENLRSALFDARETGVIPDVVSVILPDGKEFSIEN